MHRAPQTSLTVITNGVVSGGYDGRVFRFGSDARTVVWGRALPELVNDMVVHDNRIFTVGAFRSCLALDLDTGQVLGGCAEDSDDLNAVAVSQRGDSLFCGGESGRLIRVDAPMANSAEIVISNAFGCINCISILPSTVERLLVGDDEGMLAVLDFNGNELRQWSLDASVECVAVDSGRIFAGLDDGRVFLFRLEDGDLRELHAHGSAVKAIAVSGNGDGLVATAGYDNALCLLSFEGTVVARKRFAGALRDGWARCLAFSRLDPNRLYVTSLSGAPRVVEVPCLEPLSGEAPATPGLNAVASRAGQIWRGGDNGRLCCDTAGKDLGDMVLSIDVGPWGIAAGTRDGRLHLVPSSSSEIQSFDHLTRTDATGDPLNAVRWSGDGMIATGTYNGKVSVLDPSFAPILQVPCDAAVKDLCWVYDRLLLVALADGSLVAIDSKDGLIEWRHDGLCLLNSVDYHPFADRIVTVGRDMYVRTWYADGRSAAMVVGHQRSIKCVRYAPSGDRFATAAYDGDVIIWRTRDMYQLSRFRAHGVPGASALAWIDDNQVVSVGFDGRSVICGAPAPTRHRSRPVGAGSPDWARGLNAGEIHLVSRGRTAFHAYAVYRTTNWGVALEVDGDLQSVEIDQEIYHREMISSALDTLPGTADDVLVLGAGPGGSLPFLLRSGSDGSVTMIDVDPDMVRAVRLHMCPWHRGLFNDSRVREMWGDAAILLPSLDPASYDLIIVDFTDHRFDAIAARILSRDFWWDVNRVLRSHGVVVVQAGPPEDISGMERILSSMNPFFRTSVIKRVIPSFGGEWCFVTAIRKESRK